MVVLRSITASLLAGSLALLAPAAAAPAPASTPEGTSSSQVSPEILNEQAAFWENRFIRDPVTNATVPNPAYGDDAAALGKRNSFNPYSGAECRISAQHYYYPKVTCSPGHGCDADSYETQELRIIDNKNTGTNFAVFQMDRNKEQYFQLDGHRGWIGKADWTAFQWYGISTAYGRIEGRGGNRNMMGSDYCWYAQGTAWWGDWGEASCTSWCSEFNW